LRLGAGGRLKICASSSLRSPACSLTPRACMPLGATDPCKVGVVGSTPIRST